MAKPFTPKRRTFLKAIGAGLPASAGAVALVADGPVSAQSKSGSGDATAARNVSQFFNSRERITVDAVVARLIPNDELGPGAKEAGVTDFLDRQLAGPWGTGDNFYRQGPFRQGTPEQGYQLGLTPAQVFRTGLTRLDEASARQHGGKGFAQLSAPQQDALLTSLQKGEIDMGDLPGAVFFQMMLDGTMEGFFSDPMYGGNRDMAGWKLLGFPGIYASYSNDIERHNVAYVRPPMSIAKARASGHAQHGAMQGPSTPPAASAAPASGARR